MGGAALALWKPEKLKVGQGLNAPAVPEPEEKGKVPPLYACVQLPAHDCNQVETNTSSTVKHHDDTESPVLPSLSLFHLSPFVIPPLGTVWPLTVPRVNGK